MCDKSRQVPYTEIPPVTIRKFTTGRGCDDNKKADKNCKHRNNDDFCNRVKRICPAIAFTQLFINQTT